MVHNNMNEDLCLFITMGSIEWGMHLFTIEYYKNKHLLIVINDVYM